MTEIALTIFVVSHAALIVLFEKQRKKIDALQTRNHYLYTMSRRYRRIAQQQANELELAARTLTK